MNIDYRNKANIIMIYYGDSFYGGNIYENMILKTFEDDYNICRYPIYTGKCKIKSIVKIAKTQFSFNLIKRKRNSNIIIKNMDLAFIPLRRRPASKSVVVVHHLDFTYDKYKKLYSTFSSLLYKNLNKSDVVVVVADYWQDFLIKKGFQNVRKIPNAFYPDEFVFTTKEIEAFQQRHDLLGKGIVYLGNYGPGKGVEEAYQALKGLEVHFVTSGNVQDCPLPIRKLSLNYRDYQRLLRASHLAVTMSQFEEGWCRVAHEAMLCRTPVLGSGKGGMAELLQGGKQIICRDFRDLRNRAEHLLGQSEERKKLGEDGYNFAKDFTFERFKANWVTLINDLSSANEKASWV
jgi:glycosyltransferase involved in cell wall biosynthesis